MSFENPGDDKRCDWCDAPGQPYEYQGTRLSGLIPYEGERLCPSCADRKVRQETGGVADYITPRRREAR